MAEVIARVPRLRQEYLSPGGLSVLSNAVELGGNLLRMAGLDATGKGVVLAAVFPSQSSEGKPLEVLARIEVNGMQGALITVRSPKAALSSAVKVSLCEVLMDLPIM